MHFNPPAAAPASRLSPRKHLTELIWNYLAPCADIDDISATCSGRYLAFYADHLLFRAIRDIAEPLNDREFPEDKILMGGQAYTLSMNTFRTATISCSSATDNAYPSASCQVILLVATALMTEIPMRTLIDVAQGLASKPNLPSPAPPNG